MTLYMPLFRACSSSRTLTQLHAHLIVTGLHKDPLPSTKLIESYAQLGPLQSSKLIFTTFPKPDSFMWGVLIKSYVWNGFFQEAISLYHNLLYKLTQISSFIFPSILRACSGTGDMGFGQKVHGRIIKSGFESDPVVETSLLSMYGEKGCLNNARKVFDEMSIRDCVSWSSMVSSYVQNGQASEGLELFREMVLEVVEIDTVLMLSVAEACAELGFQRLAKSVHGYVVTREIESGDGSLDNSLIAMYGKCGDLSSAEGIFDGIVYRGTCTWTVMISCYNQNGSYQDALQIFIGMQECNVEPNEVTLMSILCSCARLGWLKEGKSIHGFIARKVIDPKDDLLGPALIDLYASCGNLRACHNIFDITRERHVVSWNMLISGYAQEDKSEEALRLFIQMLSQGIVSDSFTLSSVLSACGNAGFSQLGSQIHCHVIKRGFRNEFIQNSLIDMYAKCGYVDPAYLIFEDAQERGVVTWNSMISGFSKNSNSIEAITLFDQMYSNCLEMDEVTFLSVIQACSNVGYLEKGKWVHHKLITCGVKRDMYIDTALVDLYAKSGNLHMARGAFDNMLERSVVSWSAMIGGYGMHGQIDAAIFLFKKMVELGINPNEVTFMNILSACSHAGYVEEGKSYFESMVKDFHIGPKSEHFSCLVDLLSRAGDLNEAYRIIDSMPYPADASIWGSLLNGCRIHRRMDMIKSIQQNLENKKIDDTGHCTLLSNVFAEGGDWEEFRTIRSKMESTNLKKVLGCSMIEINNTVPRFGANDESSSQIKEIGS